VQSSLNFGTAVAGSNIKIVHAKVCCIKGKSPAEARLQERIVKY